jgi:hypothetical protein
MYEGGGVIGRACVINKGSSRHLGASSLRKRSLERHERVVQVMRLVAKASESLMLVEGGGRVVNGMDHGDSYAQSFSDNQNPPQRRKQERASQAPPLKLGVKPEATDQHGRNWIVAAKMLVPISPSGLLLSQREAAERVVPNDSAARISSGRIDQNIGGSGVLILVPYHHGVNVGIERGIPASEAENVVPNGIEAFDDR